MIVEQMKSGGLGNFSYLIGDLETKLAAVVDPAGNEQAILERAKERGLEIKLIFNTHRHSDHTAGTAAVKEATDAKVIMHALDAGQRSDVDIRLEEEKDFELGKLTVHVIHTPGHTPGGICIQVEDQLFTGDTLFVGDSGRTDLPGGERPTLGASIRKLMALPNHTVVWPGHDLGPNSRSTLGWEKRNNVNAREYGYYETNESEEGNRLDS